MSRPAWKWAATAALCGALAAPAQRADPAESLLQAATKKELVDGNLKAAIEGYKKALVAARSNRTVAAKALLRLGECYEKQGNSEARQSYERLVREYSDQKEQARDAGARLAAMGPLGGSAKGIVAQLIATEPDYGLWDARVLPDGRLYLFNDVKTGQLAVRDLRTGAVRQLTSGYAPVPSRDGKQIAYGWERQLRVINVDGSGMRTVPVRLKDDDRYMPADWSPDGKTLVVSGFVRVPEWTGIATVDPRTGEVRQLSRFTTAPQFEIAGFSPDGRHVVYSRQLRQKSPNWDIFALDIQSGKETAVVTGDSAERKPIWAPDSDKIVFRSDRNGKNAIWMVRFQDGQAAGAPELVKHDAGEYDPRGISRDGSLFYVLSHNSADVYQASLDPGTLRLQNAPARLVETYPGHNFNPTWSPTGDSFAYYSERANVTRLIVRQPDGKEIVAADPITNFSPSYPPHPAHWCDDGDRLLSWGTPGTATIRLFNARTGDASPPDLKVDRLQIAYQLGFSADCKSVYVSHYLWATGRRRIYRYELSTGRETDLVTDAGEMALTPRVSPDGRWLALYGNLDGGKESGILLISTAGGPLRMLVKGGQRYGSLVWTPDSKRLMYHEDVIRPDGRDESELCWVSVEGGAPQSMGILIPGATAPSLNADGKRILFSATERITEFWVLRNLPLK